MRRRSPLPELVAVSALVVAVALVAFISYRSQLDSSRQQGLDDLHAVARLKVTGLSQWLTERRADSEAVGQNLLLHNVLRDWQETGSTQARDDLLRSLRQAKNTHGFARITKWTVTAQGLLSAPLASATAGGNEREREREREHERKA